MEERIQKIIASAGLMSRRAAEAALEQGRVTVNGVTASLGEKADSQIDVICLDGVPVTNETCKIYIALNKPKGYVTTLSDEKGRRCISSLVNNLEQRVYPVGRLDIDSEGLLLLTNDGEFANSVMHPSHEINKVYHVDVSGTDIATSIVALKKPMLIDGYMIKPAIVANLQFHGNVGSFDITIHEGRNRQVRKMCAATGLEVINLRRVAEGPVQLGSLKKGCWRYLTADELMALRRELDE